ncbi:hypothetical protein [Amycolatopsis solani]|uniref:hypothetical protein n=1 Tax=Amycolatopsis solani TaxID=3028615 RepID=UPI00296E72C5|nr:hypothetical protein [Amycolatopsis sp. MEP2-6]
MGVILPDTTGFVLLNSIAELATEEYLVEPADHLAEARQNTWSLGASPEERAGLTVEQVVAAFEAVGRSLEGLASGPVTFYVWHDRQAGALKSSLSSLGPSELLFGAEYAPAHQLGPIVEEFLSDASPGAVAEPLAPLPVWVRAIAP